MPTTRHGLTEIGVDGPARIMPELIPSPFAADGLPWEPRTDEVSDPNAFGREVLTHGSLPDGTLLSHDDKRYIASLILEDVKGKE